MAIIEPLDLQTIFVDKLVGGPDIQSSLTLFIVFATLIMAVLAAKFRMPNVVFGGLMLFFIVFMSMTTVLGSGSEIKYGLLVLGCIIVALAFATAMSKRAG